MLSSSIIMKASDIITQLEALRNETQQQNLMRFFKTGEGEYGEGDRFLGLKVPQTRAVVKDVAQDFPLKEIPELLHNAWHEVRLCGLLILVDRFQRHTVKRLVDNTDAIRMRDEIVSMYLAHAEQANNWDLVDLSAPKIIGHWLMLSSFLGDSNDKRVIVDTLAQSTCLWKQRISMVCTWKPLQMGEASWCLHYAEMHLLHPHDLMRKAVGWMLREMGKRVSMEQLRAFLHQHVRQMPRTTLRYAIEKMSEKERKRWMTR